MGTRELVLIDGTRETTVAGSAGAGSLRVPAAELERALGWKLEPRGLCKDDVCIPVRERAKLEHGDGVDLAELARVAGLPLALDLEQGIAVLGASPAARAAALQSGLAPDFTLPDLAGTPHSLSQQRGRKVLLIAYASW